MPGFTATVWLSYIVLLVGAACGGCAGDDDDTGLVDDDVADDDDNDNDNDAVDDDDDDDDDNDDDDNNDDNNDNNDDNDTVGTAWEDKQHAEANIAEADFSVALTDYRECIAKLLDDFPGNDGPVEALDLARCYYGRALLQILVPLPIIEDFINDILEPEAALRALAEAWGAPIDDDIPTSLITVYILEIIVPLMDENLTGLALARDAADFSYALPPLRFIAFDQAIEIPAETVDGRGEHDRAEAHLLAALFFEMRAALSHIGAHNLDNGAMNIDYWLALLRNFDLLIQEMDRFPWFLTIHDPSEPAGIDGFALLADAKGDTGRAIAALTDDNDGDGHYWMDDNGTPLNPFDDFIDPAEVGDDWLDALRLETDDQTDDIVRWRGSSLEVNVASNGEPVGPTVNVPLNLLIGLLRDEWVTALRQTWFGDDPPEAAIDGYDNDLALGQSTALTATVLTDAAANWTPGALIGAVLNPNVEQAAEFDALQVFTIVDNDAHSVTVAGDLTAVADVGDTYSIGDGVADDQPLDVSPLLSLLAGTYVPPDATLGVFLAAIYDTHKGVRDLLPRWDFAVGNPNFYHLVVDETEDFIDNNGNETWDPGVDTLLDAAHAYGGDSYPADGAYQPYYFFFPDATAGGALTFGGDWSGADPNDALSSLLSGLLVNWTKGGRP
jgi:hypothetical protein